MASGTVNLTGGSSETIIAADANRDHLLLQCQSDNDVYLGFGEAAVNGQGIAMLYPGDTVQVLGPKARLAVYGWAAGACIIGYETMREVKYQVGQFGGPWPTS